MNMNDQQKLDILIQALQERNASVHTIRERVQTVSLWILGLLLASSGYIFQSNICFDKIQKIALAIFVLIVWLVIRKYYFADLEKGFNSQRKILAKIENALGFYEEAFFNEEKESVYPKEWKKSGQKGSEGKFFENTYNLLAVGFGILIFTILLFS